jgi:hypothetical protein
VPTEIITITPGPEFAACANALMVVDGRIHPKHTEEIRDHENPLLAMVRRNVMATPARTGQHTGLRADIAAGTHATGIGDGSTFWSTLGGSRAIIPAGLDTLPGWTHPVFGRSHVFQRGGYNWFTKPLTAAGAVVVNGLHRVNEEEADFVASHGA